ncbi:MAG TPA: YkgJ family cysteine cluster protein [Bryobacteraceae bacterium]|nr:YkgJ family cysteine cluster protein [Bryobacteraceae bacterium]
MHRGDQALIRILDQALAEAAVKSGPWLVCRPGCFQCCLGPFPITPLDARRLRHGFAELDASDPRRASAVLERSLAAGSGDDDPCPVLDPQTGTCDLYAYRPVTCRTFGPAVTYGSEAVGVCELCYDGASDEEIAACAVAMDDRIERELIETLEDQTGHQGPATVALCIAGSHVRIP